MDNRQVLYFLLMSLLVSITISSRGVSAAERYPTREIQVVTATAAGTFSDISTRLMSDSLAKNLGVPIVISNRTGGAGAAGTHFLVKAKPDGYTIGCISSYEVMLLPATVPNVPSKYSDLDALCKCSSSPTIVFCKRDSPWKNLEELVADAKKRPGQINYGATANSISYFLMEGFLKAAGIKMLHVPLPNAQQTITRILGGNLDVGVVAPAPLVGQLRAGAVRGLFLTTAERLGNFPEIPALVEKGYGAAAVKLYNGFFAPQGMPKPIRETLVKALEKTIKDPAFKKRLQEVELVMEYLPSEAFANELEEDYKRISELVKATGPKR